MRRKHVAFEGISAVDRTSYTMYHKGERQAVVAWRDKAVRDGGLIEIEVDGWRGVRWALAEDAADIATVGDGRVPARRGEPNATSTIEETTFLAPLDPVSARKRAAPLFDFDYIWEVYTPAPKRKFGYYALPVLWGDRLVARFDGRLERSTATFAILGLWLEDEALATDEAFIEAFACAGRTDAALPRRGASRRHGRATAPAPRTTEGDATVSAPRSAADDGYGNLLRDPSPIAR